MKTFLPFLAAGAALVLTPGAAPAQSKGAGRFIKRGPSLAPAGL